MKNTVKHSLELKIPQIPDFIATNRTDQIFHISELDEEQLSAIAALWKEKLLIASRKLQVETTKGVGIGHRI